jgi:hypothetical protein
MDRGSSGSFRQVSDRFDRRPKVSVDPNTVPKPFSFAKDMALGGCLSIVAVHPQEPQTKYVRRTISAPVHAIARNRELPS